MDRLRQWVDPSINAAAQPVGADAISELLLFESILVQLRRLLATNVFPVPGFPSIKQTDKVDASLSFSCDITSAYSDYTGDDKLRTFELILDTSQGSVVLGHTIQPCYFCFPKLTFFFS